MPVSWMFEARGRLGHRYIGRPTDSAQSAEDADRDESEEEDNQDHGPIAELWYHTGEDEISGYRWSALVLTVGFPEPQFSELIDACVSGRADTLVLECRGYAKTTAWGPQSARDLFLSAGESVRLRIKEATMSAPVLGHAPHSPATESGESGDRDADENEWDQEQHRKRATRYGRAGSALLIVTITVTVLSALFGAGAVVLLTIAILGGTAAFMATLSSIAAALTERLALLSEVMLQRGRPGKRRDAGT